MGAFVVGHDVVDGRYESPRESFGGGILLKKTRRHHTN